MRKALTNCRCRSGSIHRLLICLAVLGFLFLSGSEDLAAQQATVIKGVVRSEAGELLAGVTVHVKSTRLVTETDRNGYYFLAEVEPSATIIYSLIGYKTVTLSVGLLPGEVNEQNVVMQAEVRSLDEVNITDSYNGSNTMSIDPQRFNAFPQPSHSFESMIKSMPGVSANNELSSQYSVRGGNFDENLLYLNDIEISRPVLVRQGQQEGLGFINPDMVSGARFSAGGFASRYGDKLSSVLDVRYDRPDSLSLQASAGIIGNSAVFKLPMSNSYLLAGFRNKRNERLLGTQGIDGRYSTDHADYQILYKQGFGSKVVLTLFGDYNYGELEVIPERRETEFGTSDEVLKLFVNYDGSEASRYESAIGAFTLRYALSNNFNLKWINSYSQLKERESESLRGWYAFDERGSDLGGGGAQVLGRGSVQDEVNNRLTSRLFSSELRLYQQLGKSYFEMGMRYQRDLMKDDINEFTGVDTSGYSLPSTGNWTYQNVIDQNNRVSLERFSGFLQNTYRLGPFAEVVAGARASYNSYTRELQISPRASLSYSPPSNDDLMLRLAAGRYVQTPGYREIRSYNGTLNPEYRSQRSWAFLAGTDYAFNGLGTRLKLSSEIYYKMFGRLTPYAIEDLKIRYFADQVSKGYAAGADFSVSGNFASGLESVFRLSLMKTEEDIQGDSYQITNSSGQSETIYPGYLKRPSDQLLNVGILFQDRLLENPTYKVHLNLVYASALPTGPTGAQPYKNVFKIPAYKRVDIGFSKDFADPDTRRKSAFIFRYFQKLSAHAEVFNLLNIKNTVSYLWLNDSNRNQYAIPNYLSMRQFNFKVVAVLRTR